jgi:hypothetical protein
MFYFIRSRLINSIEIEALFYKFHSAFRACLYPTPVMYGPALTIFFAMAEISCLLSERSRCTHTTTAEKIYFSHKKHA